jgi:hypothetical protein
MNRLKQGETVSFNVTVEDGSINTISSISAKLRKKTRTEPYPLEGTFNVTNITNGWNLKLPSFPTPGLYVTDVSLTLTNGDVRKSSTVNIEIIPSVT